MGDVRLGVLPWSQATDWPGLEGAAKRLDQLGYHHIWAWDHLHAIFGDPDQPFFEGWLTLAAWAKVTDRARLGLLVGANTFRNPGLVAKMATTLDHVSGGRAILGLGAAWFEHEHLAHGIEFGTGVGQRLDWMHESVAAIRTVLDGGEATSPEGAHYRFRNLRQLPLPVQQHLPIMIGGSGEKKTLRTVATYADMWNAMGTVETLRHKVEVLREHCAAVGRDFAEIELTVGCKPVIRDTEAEARQRLAELAAHNGDAKSWPNQLVGSTEQVAEQLRLFAGIGYRHLIAGFPAPYDAETMDRLATEVRPMVEAV